MQPRKKRKDVPRVKRSDSLTIRLEPRIRYLLEIASRRQRRSVSSFVEAAVCDSLDRAPLDDKRAVGKANDLWDVDEVDRFIVLAKRYPELLTYHEQVVWKLIVSRLTSYDPHQTPKGGILNGMGSKKDSDAHDELEGLILDIDAVKKNWDLLHAVARGEANEAELPFLIDQFMEE